MKHNDYQLGNSTLLVAGRAMQDLPSIETLTLAAAWADKYIEALNQKERTIDAAALVQILSFVAAAEAVTNPLSAISYTSVAGYAAMAAVIAGATMQQAQTEQSETQSARTMAAKLAPQGVE